ncbi:MAG: hypothetical protein IT350_10365 [Deltaproteobacteria bacterium]|nr:hypothetical protein [Deltaproteobacteria bacterium]
MTDLPVKGISIPARRALLFCGVAAFVAVRLIVALGAVDHLHNVDRSEYQLAEYAHNIVAGKSLEYPELTHLWGHRGFATALIPFVLVAPTDTVAMKLAAIALATLGFAALTAFVFRVGGLVAAVVFALLMIFPERSLLKWNLTYWGAHPESALLAGIGVWAWGNGLIGTRRAQAWFAGAGVVVAASIYASAAVFYVVALVFVLTASIVPRGRRARALAALGGGFAVAIAPLAVRLAGGLRERLFEPAVFDNTSSVAMTAVIGAPSAGRLALFFAQDWMRSFYLFRPEWAITALAAVVVIARFRDAESVERGRARLLFPLSLAVALVVVSMFGYVTHLHTRHLLWLIVAGYACVAMALGSPWTGERLRAARPVVARIEVGAKIVLVAVLVGVHAWNLSPLVQPAEFDMLGRFRGEVYARHFLGQIVGDEVDRVNALLDARIEELGDADFVAGMGEIFRMSGVYDCCLWEPVRPDVEALRVPVSADSSTFFQGVGCALALKSTAPPMLARIADRYGAPAAEAANAGHERCGMFTPTP